MQRQAACQRGRVLKADVLLEGDVEGLVALLQLGADGVEGRLAQAHCQARSPGRCGTLALVDLHAVRASGLTSYP